MGNELSAFDSRKFTDEQKMNPSFVGTIAQSQFIECVTSATKGKPLTGNEVACIMKAVASLPTSEGKIISCYLDGIAVVCLPLHTAMGYGGVEGRLRSDSQKESRTWRILRREHGDEKFLVVITYGESMHFLGGLLDKPENNGYCKLGTMAHRDFDEFKLLQTYVHVFRQMTQDEIRARAARIQRHSRGNYSPLSPLSFDMLPKEPVPLLEI